MNLLSDRPADPLFLGVTLIFCAIAGVIASAWCIHIDDVINNDGDISLLAEEVSRLHHLYQELSSKTSQSDIAAEYS